MQSSTTDPRCGWRRAKGGEVAHFWRVNYSDGALVSLCNITHGQRDRREYEGPAVCPICREGLRRAQLVGNFLETHIHLDAEGGGQHLQVEPWYWWGVLLPIYGTLSIDSEGDLRRVFTRAYVGVPRWHIKSTSAAGLGLYHLTMEPMVGTELYAVATSLGQAGAIFRKARRMAVSDELLSAALYAPRSIIECRETGAIFKAAQGFHPQFAAIDEIHVHKNRKMIDAMVSGSVGFKEPMVLLISTAGEQRKGVWWDLLRDWRDDPGTYIYWCGAKDGDDPTDPDVWRRANPASWIGDEALLRQFRAMPLPSFMRYHLNLAPTTGANHFFDADRWDACSARPVFDPKRPCVVAVDASLRRDHTVVVLDQLGEDNVHNVMCFPFTAEEDDSIMSAIDQDEVGMLLRDLANSYRVVRMPCDQAYFVGMMRQLLVEGLPIEAFAQKNEPMARACQSLFDAVAEGRVRHGGDSRLREYVLNAVVKETTFGPRFNKPDAESKIDGAIALAMAVNISEVEAAAGHIRVVVG